jgi:drug/metabolite transporter (DMT)-like permease
MIAGMIFFREELSAVEMIGAVLVLASCTAVFYFGKRKSATGAAAPSQ